MANSKNSRGNGSNHKKSSNNSREKKSGSRDYGTILFRVIGIELVVVACLVGFGIYHYAGPMLGEAVNQIFGKKTPGNPTDNMTMYTEDLPTLAPVQQSTEAQTEGEKEPAVVRITALGDNLMQSSCVLSGQQPDGSFSFDRHFSNIQPLLAKADIGIISQDTVAGGSELGLSEKNVLNAPYELADAMKAAGINVVLAANNHILDKGKQGVVNMINCWSQRCPDAVLAGVNASVEQKVLPVYIESKGVKIAILNYTDVALNSEELTAEPYLVNYYDKNWITNIMEEARKEADFVIVFPFWGQQDNLNITADQENQAKLLADLGADLIIGNYPHVVEPVKWITASDGREVLVYYSLGNFQSNQSSLQNMLGAAANVEITKTDEGTSITDYDFDFIVTHYQVEGSADYYNIVTTYLLDDYSEELASRHGLVVSGTDTEFSIAGLQGLGSQILQKCELKDE